MSDKITEGISLIANLSAVLTAVIAVVFFLRSLKRSYYLNDILGNYKIFSGLKGEENATVLNQIVISYVSEDGWIFGYLKYSEIYKNEYARSGGGASVVGKVNYSYWRKVFSLIYRLIRLKKFNPLEPSDIGSFHGVIYLLSRNDLDVSKTDWKSMITQEYSIIHYKDSQRFKLYRPKFSNSYLQLPDELTLVNIERIYDPMYDHEIT